MLPVRGATHGHSHRQGLIHISIHAPRAGSDSGIVTEMLLILDFNPCSPCGERQTWAAHRPRHKDFNPCSPCGERPAKAKKLFESGMKISIHAPRAGSDDPGPLKASWIQYFNPCSPCGERLWLHSSWREAVQFQSMLPVRGATPGPDPAQPKILISIHAPRAGSDPPPGARGSRWCNFNPCSPCGERPSKTPLTAPRWNFNPCSPCGERLQQVGHRVFVAAISIHAPRAGSDPMPPPS